MPEEPKPQTPDANKNVSAPKVDAQKAPAEAKPAEAPANSPKPDAQPANGKATETKPVDKTNAALRPSASGAGTAAPSATSTVEHDVLKEFKSFASQQRQNAEKARSNKAKADKEVKLTELKKFASSFKLSTPVPTDLVSIIAKDPVKQKEIQAKAIKNAEDVAKAKAEAARSHIQSLARTLADETTHTLKIDPKYHRELIGAQGSQINRLQTRYKVHIFFPRSAKPAADDQSNADAASDAGKPRRQQPADEVIIRGPKKGADEARDEIFSLHKYLEEHSAIATVAVQQKQVGSLIGQGGAALDDLRQATGAKIDVPADRDTDIVEIQIKGTAAQVAKAKKILEEKRAIFDDTVVQTIEVDKKHH